MDFATYVNEQAKNHPENENSGWNFDPHRFLKIDLLSVKYRAISGWNLNEIFK